MTAHNYRLAPSTVVEPLINKWSAWSHLIPPVPYSLHLQNYQVNLLQSYLRYPKVHVQTCQNPSLRYGPFVDVSAERAGEIKTLLDNTKATQSENFKLAESVTAFHDALVKEAKGQSLEPFYAKAPEPLRGYIELIYDYDNQPIIRYLERLLYESPYYDSGVQSLKLFRQKRDNSRSFFMSTPRLVEDDQIDWAVPFDNPRVDELFKLDCAPQPLGYIREVAGLSAKDEELLSSFLSDEVAAPFEKWSGQGVRIRYIGHACALVEFNGICILTDPWIGVMPEEGEIQRVTFADLPEKIDYAIVTHNHPDHFGIETLLRLRHRIECLVVHRSFGIFYGDISLKLLTRQIGFKNVIELETFESIPLPGGEIISVPFVGEQADLPHSKTAYIIRAGEQQILFGADSNCLDKRLYEHLRKFLGPVQTVFIGMECVGAPLSWMYAPFLPYKLDFGMDQSRRLLGCDAFRAMEILDALGAERIYIYAMGLEPWLEYLLGLAVSQDSAQIQESNKLLAQAKEKGLTDAKLLFGTSDIHLQ